MRSTLVYLAALFIPALASAAIGVGCDASGSALFGDGSQTAGKGDLGEPGENFGGTTSPDASGAPSNASRGSPLCAISPDKCIPDEDGTSHTYGDLCATPPDAGVNPTVDAGSNGCRLGRKADNDTTYEPKCFAADRRGVDGVACYQGSDCAPGFDCVDGEKGSVCRRYCCSPDSCNSQVSQNGGPTFCDIQKIVDVSSPSSSQKAPVCMPLKTCELLKEGECGPKETCAADLTKKGDTGCVATGTKKAGEACDDDHCDVGLTCLGNPGDRRCYQLCKTNSSVASCPAGQTCTTGSIFPTAYGVCTTKTP